jgi:outer membrane protein TolC
MRRLFAYVFTFFGMINFFMFYCGNTFAADYLSLGDYRDAVQRKSLKISSLQDEKSGSALESYQGKFLTSPQAFVEFEDLRDKSPVIAPEFMGTERNTDELRTGLQMQSSFGLKPRVFAFTQNQRFQNVSALDDPNISLQRKGYGVEGEISVWKNAFGKDIRGRIQSSRAISESKSLEAEASRIAFQTDAEVLYYETVFLSEAIKIQSDLIAQGERIVQWTTTQSNNRLLEPVHIAQAMAAHQSRKFALITLKQRLQSNLYKMSQLTGLEIGEQMSFDSIDKLYKEVSKWDKKFSHKITVKGLAKAIEAERIDVDLAAEDFKPDLSLKAQYLAFNNNGRADDSSRCKSSTDCRSLSLFVNFTVPLDVSTWKSGSQAANSRIESLRKNFEAELQNSQVEMRQLQSQVNALEDQIVSLEKLIDAQEKRLKRERERQSRGRATTFDLILSEQDLGESRITLAEIKAKYVSTISQFNLFEEAL